MSRFGMFALFVLTSCSTEPPLASTASSLDGPALSIEAFTDSVFAGRYDAEPGTVTFTARVESETRISATAYANDVRIDLYATSEEGGHVGFQVSPPELDDRVHALVDGLHLALAERFPYPEEGAKADDTPPHVQLLRSYLGFLSEAPARLHDGVYDVRLDTVELHELKRLEPPRRPPPPPPPPCNDVADNDGVTILPACCGGGTNVEWQHDDLPGGHCFTTTVSWCGTRSPGMGGAFATPCPGRCGKECYSFPGYYQDCLDHDLCTMHDAGGNGLTSTKCGDEFQDAVDDFAIAYSAWAPMFWWLRTGTGACP